MFPNSNGGPGDRPLFLPPDAPEPSAPPKSRPGDGLKEFAQSGALAAFKDPHGASSDKQASQAGPQLMNFLKMIQG